MPELRRVRIGVDEETGFEGWLLPYTDARRDVVIRRELIDIWKGNPGKPDGCMNHECILRNANAFPHAVFAASVIKSRVYIVDKVSRKDGGSPVHVVRYTLSAKDGNQIDRHDVLHSAIPATLTLKAPRGGDRAGATHGQRPRPSGKHNKGKGSLPLVRGEKARLLAAVGVVK